AARARRGRSVRLPGPAERRLVRARRAHARAGARHGDPRARRRGEAPRGPPELRTGRRRAPRPQRPPRPDAHAARLVLRARVPGGGGPARGGAPRARARERQVRRLAALAGPAARRADRLRRPARAAPALADPPDLRLRPPVRRLVALDRP